MRNISKAQIPLMPMTWLIGISKIIENERQETNITQETNLELFVHFSIVRFLKPSFLIREHQMFWL